LINAKALDRSDHDSLAPEPAFDDLSCGRKSAGKVQAKGREIADVYARHDMCDGRTFSCNPLRGEADRSLSIAAALEVPVDPQIVQCHAASFCPYGQGCVFPCNDESHDPITIDKRKSMLAGRRSSQLIEYFADGSTGKGLRGRVDGDAGDKSLIIETDREQRDRHLTHPRPTSPWSLWHPFSRFSLTEYRDGLRGYQSGAKA
jgi:hypothetical protein